METFSIQLIFTYICLSNANYNGENHVMVQRQMSFEPKNDTTWDGIMDSWNKIFWSNQNFVHGDYAPRVRTRLRTKSSKFAGFNSQNRFCTYLLSSKHCDAGDYSLNPMRRKFLILKVS